MACAACEKRREAIRQAMAKVIVGTKSFFPSQSVVRPPKNERKGNRR